MEKDMLILDFAKTALPYSTMPTSVWIIASSEKRNRRARSALFTVINLKCVNICVL